jgi:hypothetical protein
MKSHLGRCREFGVSLDHLVDSIQHVLFRDLLAASTDSIHPCFRAHAAQVCSGTVRAQAREQLKPYFRRAIHVSRMNPQNLRATFEIRNAEFHPSIHPTRAQQRRI